MAVIKVIQKDGTTKKFDTASKKYVADNIKLTSDKIKEAKAKGNKKNSGTGSVSAEAYNKLAARLEALEEQLGRKASTLTKKDFKKLSEIDKEQYELSEDGSKYVLKGEQ